MMKNRTFSELRRMAGQSGDGFPTSRLSVLADTSSQLLVQAIRGEGIARGVCLEISEADYNQIELQLNNLSSDFHQYSSDAVLIYEDVSKLVKQFRSSTSQSAFAERHAERVKGYYDKVISSGASFFLYFNFPIEVDPVFGNFANKLENSFAFQARKLNLRLMELASEYAGFHICDLAALTTRVGRSQAVDPRMQVNAEIHMSLSFLPEVAKSVVDMLLASMGKVKKCLILDLDNTLWGGVIGDDGVSGIQIGEFGIGKAFTALQLWARDLVQRGVILAVCSKNTDSIARQPFEEHPDMVLSLDDIAVFVANWDTKPDNIRYIQSILGIGFDSMVFIDDNPFERNIVREHVPSVLVPELPEDPAEYLVYLQSLNLFETISYSENDHQRTLQYRNEAKRVEAKQGIVDESDFLKSLRMKSVVAPFDDFTVPRVAQLCQRSNQFNLRTMRYSDTEIKQFASSECHMTLSFTLADKFGDSGLVGVVILEQLSDLDVFIDTWIMSCRVLKRTMETFMLNCIVDATTRRGFKRLFGEYIRTGKNAIVENLYADLEFMPNGSDWVLNMDAYHLRETYVGREDE